MEEPKLKYPWVNCSVHGRQLGYIVCVHIVRDGAEPVMAEHELPTSETVGALQCAADHPDALSDFVLLCELHALQYIKSN